MSFYDQLQNTLTNSPVNRSVTENGAVGFRTTGAKLLDLNFAVSSLRGKSETEIETRFAEVLGEDFVTAVVWLFWARDIRGGGMGERRLFRICMRYLAREFHDKVTKLIPLVAEYGRWDDLLCLLDTRVATTVANTFLHQLNEDMQNMRAGKSISLCSKWCPSASTSSKETRKKAEQLQKAFGWHPAYYRRTLSTLRRYIDVTERKMSRNQWGEIKYEAVPSRANLNYNSAFLRHDEARRREYLGKLEKGETKINSSVLFPYDIVHKYVQSGGYYINGYDTALEAMWKGLPNTVEDGAGTIVVADGSGSMTSPIGNTKVSAWEVATSLAIYFAERLPGAYKDKYITFSATPQIVDLGGSTTLHSKLQTAHAHDECTNTNIEAVFDLILGTAITNRLSQREVPKNVLIISDLEFDAQTSGDRGWYGAHFRSPSKLLFEEIAEKYRRAGYQLPRLVFWNVNSRTGTIPVKENNLGVALVSGFSPNVAKMVMSGKLDPYEALMDTLNVPRYDAVREALK